MFYSNSTGGFYHPEIHAGNMPSDVIELTNEEYNALLDGQSAGKLIKCEPGKKPFLQEPVLYVPTQAENLARAQEKLRSLREPMLNAVVGIGTAAVVSGNTELAEESVLVRQKLLDIIKTPALLEATTYEAMEDAGLAAYKAIAAAASPALKSAFRALDE